MKTLRILSLIGLTLFTQACGNNSNPEYTKEIEGKLSTDLVANPNTLDSQSHKNISLGCLQFTDTVHNFGHLKEGEVVEYEFTYTNIGGKDVLIHQAKASCGCTVPVYNHDTPIKPKETGSMKVTFNSQGKKGHNRKSVIVLTNGQPSEQNIYIEADVD